MDKEKEIKILMEDGFTKSEAEKALKNGYIIYDDLEENFDKYMNEWKSGFDEDDYLKMVDDFKKMITTGVTVRDWSIVIFEGKKYYIQACL